MLTVDKSRKNNQIYVNHKLTRGLYFFYKELNYKSILINLQELNSINLWQIEKLANIVSEGISQVINSFA